MRRIVSGFAGALAVAAALHGQPVPRLVRDINHTAVESSSPTGFVAGERSAFFFARDENGQELWRTDGTAAGTEMVRDIAPGPLSSITESYQRMVLSGDYVYFWASATGDVSQELWRSDGTARGTVRISNLGWENQHLGAIAAIGTRGAIFTDGDGQRLYVTDGSPEGTKLVAEDSVFTFDDLVSSAGAVYFSRFNDLWRTDGTAGGTRLVTSLDFLANIDQLIDVNGTLFMIVSNGVGNESSTELWRSDGTEAGTRPFATFRTQPTLRKVRDALFIVVPSPDSQGTEIWKSDGTDKGTAKTMTVPGLFEPGFNILTSTDDLLFFSVFASSSDSSSIVWRSDGTSAGTWTVGVFQSASLTAAATHEALFVSQSFGELGVWISDGAPVMMTKISSVFIDDLTALGHWVIGTAFDDIHGGEPWISAGPGQGTHLIKNIFADGSSWAFQARRFDGNRVLFEALDDDHGFEPWITDGTAEGTRLVADINPAQESSWPEGFADVGNGTAIFAAQEPANGRELWATDGTPEGTHLVRNMARGKNDAFGDWWPFAVLGGRTFFFFADQLWSTDGSDAGTRMIADIGGPFYAERMLVAGQRVYVGTTEGLFAVDGASEQTVRLADFGNILAVVGGNVFFTGTGYGRSGELWVTDGTPAGTRLVKTVRPSPENEIVDVFPYGGVSAAAGGALYFFADDGVHGTELWRSDGTDAGTRMVKDIAPGPDSSFVNVRDPMVAYRDSLYFVADDGLHGAELWRTDGTAQGTVMVRDINPDGPSSSPSSLTVIFDTLYFAADDGVHGREPWSTDGTTTEMICDLNPGAAPSAPSDFIALPRTILFFATRDDVGREPWAIDFPPPRHRAAR